MKAKSTKTELVIDRSAEWTFWNELARSVNYKQSENKSNYFIFLVTEQTKWV